MPLPALCAQSNILLLSSGPLAAAAGSRVTPNRHFGCQPEALPTSMRTVIYGNVFGLFMEIFVNHHSKTVDPKHFIRFLRFIQNHRQRGPGSPTCMQKDTDRCDLLVLEILIQDLFRCLRNMDH
jgi:hypothetical protein